MRARVRLLVAAFFYATGIVGFVRWWMRCRGPRLVVLNYHRAGYGDLRRHMLYLRRHYRVLHLDEALAELLESDGRGKEGRSADRRTMLALTFDDGYHDNYTHAFALARTLQVPITIFLVPGYIDSGDYFWWGEGTRLLQRAWVRHIELEGCSYYLDREEDQLRLRQWIDERIYHAASVVEREALLAMLRHALAVPSERMLEDEKSLPLTWAEVYKMQESGWVSFGAHTMHHPVLSCLADPLEVRCEISESRRILEQRLGQTIRSFAYPIGRMEQIGVTALQEVQMAGYSWGLTTLEGVNTPESDHFLLRRVPTDVGRHWLLVAAEVAGIWRLCAPLWKAFTREEEIV